MRNPVNFFHALNRLPFDEKLTVAIEPAGANHSGVNLIGTMIRNPNGFAFLEVDADIEPKVTLAKPKTKTATKKPSKKGR